MLRIFLALWLAITPVFAWAGSMTLLGVGSPGGAVLSPVTLTYQTSGIGSVSTNTITFGTITIGAAANSNRRIVVVFTNDNNTDPEVSAVFTPNAGSPINADTYLTAGTDVFGFTQRLVSAVLPLGTTTTLTITYTGSTVTAPTFFVYTVDNSTLSSPTAPVSSYGAFTTSPSTVTANLQAGGGLIANYWGFQVTTEGWTAGVTSDGTLGKNDAGHLSNTSATAGYSVTNTWTVSGSAHPDIALWVYR